MDNPDGPIRLFVGTDQRMQKAEVAYERSLRAHCSLPVELTWLRAGDDGFTGWANQPKQPHPAVGWATGFTCFRFAVPELAGFTGRAIWTDVDMVILGDMAELWRWKTKKPWFTQSTKRTDVSVIECEPFRKMVKKGHWPSIESMKRRGVMAPELRRMLMGMDFIETGLPDEWNHMDRYEPGRSKLVHFTDMRTQPWKPWPERFGYPKHRDQRAVDLFWKWANADD